MNDLRIKKHVKVYILAILLLTIILIGVPLITIIDYFLTDCIKPMLSLRVCGLEASNYMWVYYVWLGVGCISLAYLIIKFISRKDGSTKSDGENK